MIESSTVSENQPAAGRKILPHSESSPRSRWSCGGGVETVAGRIEEAYGVPGGDGGGEPGGEVVDVDGANRA